MLGKWKFGVFRMSNLILLPVKIVLIFLNLQASDKFLWSNLSDLGSGNLLIIDKLVSGDEAKNKEQNSTNSTKINRLQN